MMSAFANGLWPGIKAGLKNFWNRLTGSGLTDAEQAANAFSSQEAEKNRMFQQQMSNSEYQRSVIDMQNAGLNPALMYGSGSRGASTPSGGSAASVTPNQSDPVGLLGQIANLSLLRSQKANIDADTEKKQSETNLTKENILKAGAEIQSIQANVRNMNLSSDAQEIINSYLDRMQNVTLHNATLEGNKLSAEWSEIQQKISNLRADELKTLQDIVESKQRVANLLSEKKLTDEQVKEVESTIKKIDQETANLLKSGELTQRDIDYYEWNHGESYTIFGSKPGFRMRAKSSRNNTYYTPREYRTRSGGR